MIPKLSVVIPCYNEQKRLAEGFNHHYSFLKKQNYNWELIFVNDGSKDKTKQIIKNLMKNKKGVKLISYANNKGKGRAILEGIKSAKGKYILFSDLDHSVQIKTINEFFKHFEQGYKVVIGSRRVKGAKFLKRQPFLRELLGGGFTLLVKIFIYFPIKDSTCGFKAFENETAQTIFSKVSIFGWAFDAEIIFLCKKKGIEIFQAPVQWSDVKGSKVSLWKDIIKSFLELFKIRINNLRGFYD